jgi:hypothetical protein
LETRYKKGKYHESTIELPQEAVSAKGFIPGCKVRGFLPVSTGTAFCGYWRCKMIKKGDRVFVKKEYQDPGDDCFQWIACEDEDGGRVLVSTVALGSIHPTGVFHTYMLETAEEHGNVA